MEPSKEGRGLVCLESSAQQPQQTGTNLKNFGGKQSSQWLWSAQGNSRRIKKAGHFEFSCPYLSSISCTLVAEQGSVVPFPVLSGVGTAAGLALPAF